MQHEVSNLSTWRRLYLQRVFKLVHWHSVIAKDDTHVSMAQSALLLLTRAYRANIPPRRKLPKQRVPALSSLQNGNPCTRSTTCTASVFWGMRGSPTLTVLPAARRKPPLLWLPVFTYVLACLVQNFLEKLFDWASEGAMPTKKSQPSRKRDVVFLCGGTG